MLEILNCNASSKVYYIFRFVGFRKYDNYCKHECVTYNKIHSAMTWGAANNLRAATTILAKIECCLQSEKIRIKSHNSKNK